MQRGIFASATALALILGQVGLPVSTGVASRAYAQTAQEDQSTEEEKQAEEAAKQQAEEAAKEEGKSEETQASDSQQPPAEEQAQQPAAQEQQQQAEETPPAEEEKPATAEQQPAEEQQEVQQQAEETPPAQEQQPATAEQQPAAEEQAQEQQVQGTTETKAAGETQSGGENAPAAEAQQDTTVQQNTAVQQDGTVQRDGKRRTRSAETAPDENPQPQPEELNKSAQQVIQEAAEQPIAIVPDNLSEQQQQQLKQAERKRREESRERRNELLGAAAAGFAVGALVPMLGGRVVVDQGDRFVVERDGEFYVRHDDSARFRGDGAQVEIERLRGGRTRETITRRNGVRIITVRDPGGYVLRRVKETPDGRRIVLFDIRDEDGRQDHVDYGRRLPPLRVDVPRERYIVSSRRANRREIRETFLAPPVERVQTGYSLREVRENERLRNIVRRVDVDTITFAFGSSAVRQSEVDELSAIAGGMLDVIEDNPGALFLVEGHTDAVGKDVDNLVLSDRRAESVAQVLSEGFGVPPENMVTEGYGEEFLKVATEGPSEENRRVTIRNISPLLTSQNDQ